MDKQAFYAEAMPDSRGPLEGIHVLEATNFGAGPICGMVLSDLGAESIKCEQPGPGDPIRQMPPFLQDDHVEGSIWYLTFNRGKRTVTLNFRHPEGQALFKKLAAKADIVVENFTPGTMDKWGLGYQDIRAVKPDIVYVSISGFGQFGPLRDKKGFDPIAQAMGGYMYTTGERDGRPLRAGPAVADNMTGWQAAMGAMAALLNRARTGQGQHVETSLTDALLYTTDIGIMGAANAGYDFRRNGNSTDSGAPFNTFVCKDGGHIFINACYDTHWPRLCELMGREDLKEDARTKDFFARTNNSEFIDSVVSEWATTGDLLDISAQLDAAGVTAGPVNDFKDVIQHPHYREREAVVDVENSRFGSLTHYGVPTKYSRTPARIKGRPPFKGEHNAEIYGGELGLSDDELATLAESGAI